MFVWDYRTGDVIDTETGAVVDRIYVAEPFFTSDGEVVYFDPIFPSVPLKGSYLRVFRELVRRAEEVLGRRLAPSERAELAKDIVLAWSFVRREKRLAGRIRLKGLWVDVALHMFLSPRVPVTRRVVRSKASLVASSIVRTRRSEAVLSLVERVRSERPWLVPVAIAVYRYMVKKGLARGRAPSTLAAVSVYVASQLVDDQPLTKARVREIFGRHPFQEGLVRISSSPFRVLADRELCEEVSKVARLHERVLCS